VSADEPDVHDVKLELHGNHNAVVVAFDVEDNPFLVDDACRAGSGACGVVSPRATSRALVRLVRDASKQGVPGMPLIVFFDLNLPPARRQWL
jgi:hypothetical protein